MARRKKWACRGFVSVLERRGRKEVSGKVVEIEKTAPQRETISSLVGTEEQKQQQIERERDPSTRWKDHSRWMTVRNNKHRIFLFVYQLNGGACCCWHTATIHPRIWRYQLIPFDLSTRSSGGRPVTTRSFFLIRRPAVVSVVSSGWWVSESSTASFPSRDPWRWPSPRKKKSCAEKTNRPDPSLLSFLAEDGGQIATPYRNLFLNIKIKLWGTCGWEGNGRHRENAVQS